MSITILKPGIMSSVQDLGRWGYQQYGVPVGGAMDKISASLANIICGNDENEAVIEITLHGTTILFNEAMDCALVGGGCKAYVDEVELPFNRLLHIPAYSVITTKPSARGCRMYLSIAGGFNIKKEMGSASTYVPSGIGGMLGRNLISGDIIPFSKKGRDTPASSMKMIGKNTYASHWEVPDLHLQEKNAEIIHILSGPEFDLFQSISQEKLLNATFTISSQSNRMGYRLEGTKLELKEKAEMVSTPVTAGIIQVTHEGNPIILMADAQTTGGYPRIARVASTDIAKLAQMRPGMKIRFKKISEEESKQMNREVLEIMKKMKNGLVLPRIN
jgi:antagonist of KipI